MSITKIHGFIRGSESLSTKGTQLHIAELALIEAATPATSLAEVVNALPSVASGPGSLVNNPMRLTFTLNHTRHPYSNLFYLSSISMKKKDDDRFWEIQMSYETPAPSEATQAAQKKNKKKQKVKKPDSKKIKDQVPIEDPMDRPPEWDGSVKSMTRNRLTDLDGIPIAHQNGLLISKPIPFHLDTISWQWAFNISLANLQVFMEDFHAITSTINGGNLLIPIGKNDFYFIPALELRCAGGSYSEEFETVSITSGTGKKDEPTSKEFHYVRVQIGFEYTPGVVWDQPPVSNHTKQWNTFSRELVPIPVNDLGVTSGGTAGIAKEPWPLLPGGAAISFKKFHLTAPEDYGKLIKITNFNSDSRETWAYSSSDPYPPDTPIRMYRRTDFQFFIDTYKLTLPIIDD